MILLFKLGFAFYLGALLASAILIFGKRDLVRRVTLILLGIGNLSQVLYIAIRWVEAGRPPFSNMFESLVLFAWAIVAIYLFMSARFKMPVLTVAVSVFALLTLAYTSSFNSDIEPLVPALQSNWLTVHVFTCFLAYAGFAISFLAGIIYLIGDSGPGRMSTEGNQSAELLVGKSVSFGFLFLTMGIISGSVWANSAWGTYWSWDPKETWSLITWLIYAVFLHCRYMRGWAGKKAAWVSIVGFVSVLFTYVGVNLLLSGLHSYGSK